MSSRSIRLRDDQWDTMRDCLDHIIERSFYSEQYTSLHPVDKFAHKRLRAQAKELLAALKAETKK